MRVSPSRTHPYRFARVGVAVAAVLASLAKAASAETPQQIAEAHFKAGLKLYNQDNFEAARLEFLQANAVYPRLSLLRNLALCELKTNRPLEALLHLRTYLADPASDSRDFAKKNMDDAYARTGHVTVRATEGAALTVDGQAHGNAPFNEPVDLLPGKHAFEVHLGERKVARDIDAPAGSLIEADLRFEEKPAALSRVAAPSGETRPAAAPIDSPPQHDAGASGRWLLPAGLGLGFVVGAGMGLGFASAHQSSVDDADRINASAPGGNVCASAASDGCRARQDKLSTASNQATISNVSYVVGGLFLAGAITSAIVLYWPRASTSNVALVPVLGPGTGGLQLSRSF